MPPIHRCCASLAFALAVLSACATNRQLPPFPVAANARALEARTLDDPRLLRFVAAGRALAGSAARARAWDLDTLSLAALYYHPDLDLARARLASARASAAAAAQAPNPSANLGLGYNATTSLPSPWTVGLMVDFIVETFGKREYRAAQAGHLAQAARADLASATWRVRAGVRDALLDMWVAARRRALARRQLEARQRLARLVERRFEAGAASAPELARERMARDRVRLALDAAQRDGAAARARLAQAIGVPLRALHGVAISLDAFDAPQPVAAQVSAGTLRETALTRRDDVQALLAEYAAAQSALQLELARRWPDLRLGPGYTYDQGDHRYSLAVGGELPLFNRNQGPIAAAEARREEVAARFNALQAGIAGAIDAAAAGLRAAARTRASADELVAEAARREDALRRAFDAGQLGRPALVAAQVELGAARMSDLDALAAERRALALLEDALHAPFFGAGDALPLEQRNPRIATEDQR